MTMNSSSNDNSTTPATKQPYQKPSFRYEKVFVTTALSCGKIGSTQRVARAIRRCHELLRPSIGRTRTLLNASLASEVLRSSGSLHLRVTGWSMLPTVWPGDTLDSGTHSTTTWSTATSFCSATVDASLPIV